MRDGYAEVNGVQLHYLEEGDRGTGPLMLFLHGFPEFSYEWKLQLKEFGRDHHAVAPDMRGYNLSSKPAEVERYRMALLVEDIRQLAQHLLDGSGRSTFTLLAHDWGGGVAWSFAIAHLELLDRLIIINMAHPATFDREMKHNQAQQQASQYMLRFRDPAGNAEETFNADSFDRIFGHLVAAGRFGPEDRRRYVEAWSQPGAIRGGLNYYRAARIGPPSNLGPTSGNYAIDPAQTTVKAPTLVIWGEQDTALTTANLDGLEQYVPNLRIERIPDGTHWVLHEQPERVNELIREFTAGM